MSLQSRRELLLLVQKRYQQADWCEKRKILDELIATTNYRRKYIISFFNRDEAEIIERKKSKRLYRRQYDEAVHQALLTLWYAANQICSKRLVPFIPELLPTLERFGHLFVSPEVRERL